MSFIRPAELLLAVCLSIFLGCTTWNVSTDLHARWLHRAEAVQHQLAIAERVPMIIGGAPGDVPEFRSRVLIPFILKAMQRLQVLKSDQVRYMAIRLVTATGAFFLVWAFLRLVVHAPMEIALLVMAWMAMWLITAFNGAWEVPTDVTDVIFLLAALTCTLQQRRLTLVVVVLVGTLNRESAAYFGILWGTVVAAQARGAMRTRELLFAVALIGMAVAEMLVLRHFNGLPNSPVINHPMVERIPAILGQAFRELPYPGWIVPTTTGTIALAAWLWVRRGYATTVDRSLIWTALILLPPTWVFTVLSETRVYLPMILMAMVAAAMRETAARHTRDRPSESPLDIGRRA